ncbi:MAG: hypothetical protein ACRBF0_21410 [Calditrichia bacterium]
MFSVIYFNKAISKNFQDVLKFAFVCLIFGHFLLREFMPSPIVGAVGGGILFLILFYVLCHKRDVFGFILIVFICCHFAYAESQGGLWNLLAFGLILIYYFTGKPIKRLGNSDFTMNSLLLALVISNLVGWILRNEMTGAPYFLGIFSFLGMLLCYILMSRVVITPERVKVLLYTLCAMMITMFVVAMNQRFEIVTLNTPLLGSYSADGLGQISAGSIRATSSLRHSELFGEYSMLMITLAIPLIVSNMTQKFLKLRKGLVFWLLLFALFNVLLSGTRSAFLLVILTGIVYTTFFLVIPIAIVDARRKYISYILIILTFLSVVGTSVGLESTLTRLERTISDRSSITVTDITSGEAINRGPLFLMGMQRISSDNWLVGYGSGIPLNNYNALFNGRSTIYSDFHSLYFALPIIYGWVGAFAYLGIILVILLRLIKIMISHRKTKHYLMPLIIGLSLFWILLLADQFKISILRMMNYQMLVWVFLGLSSAVIRTFQLNLPSTAVAKPRDTALRRNIAV